LVKCALIFLWLRRRPNQPFEPPLTGLAKSVERLERR
jgi:hypothetical protein